VSFAFGFTFVLLAILGLRFAFASGNSSMRVILSLYHISTFYNLFLLNVQPPAFLSSYAKGFMSTILKWTWIWDMFIHFGWMNENESEFFATELDTASDMQSVEGINPSFVTLGYTSTLFTKNLGMICWFYFGFCMLMLLSCACNFKGSH